MAQLYARLPSGALVLNDERGYHGTRIVDPRSSEHADIVRAGMEVSIAELQAARTARPATRRTRPAAARPAAASNPGPSVAAQAPPPQSDPASMGIIKLCVDAGRPDLAAKYIAERMTIAEARHALAVASWETPLRIAQAAA